MIGTFRKPLWGVLVILLFAAGEPLPSVAGLVGGVQQDEPVPLPSPRLPVWRPPSDVPLCQSYWPMIDPTKGQIRVAPKVKMSSRETDPPQCATPDRKWQLLGEDRGQCCLLAPTPRGLDGRVTQQRDMPALERDGWRCTPTPDDRSGSSAWCEPPLRGGTATGDLPFPQLPGGGTTLPGGAGATNVPGPRYPETSYYPQPLPTVPVTPPRPVTPGAYDPCKNPVPPKECPPPRQRYVLPKNPPPLQGQVAKNEINPSGEVWPPFQAISDALNKLAPHYDMTRPNEGLRVIRDIVINIFLGRIAQGLPGAARSLFGRTGERWGTRAIPNIPPRTAPPGFTWQQLPPGVTIPSILRNTPRPVIPQEAQNSCVQACSRMVAETISRRSWPENFLREISRGPFGELDPNAYNPLKGTGPEVISKLLDLMGIKNSGLRTVTIEELADAVKSGYPAIAGVRRGTERHAIIVDGVVGVPGNRFFFLRDPINLGFAPPETRLLLEQAGFSTLPVVSESEFVGNFLWEAILTNP